MGDGDGGVEIVAEGVQHGILEGLHLRRGRGLLMPLSQRAPGLHKALVAFLGRLQGFIGEVQRAAVVGLENEEPHGHGRIGLREFGMAAAEEFRQGDEVPEGLAHLLPVDGDHIVMHPVMDALRAAGSHILGDFAFVVREHEVHAAAMDVELLSQVLGAHHRALQVPAGEAVPPGGRPAHDVLRLGLFPEGEIVRGALVSLAVQRAGAFQRGFQRTAAQDAVIVVPVVLAHIEIDGAVALISIAGFQDFLDSLDLFDDMTAGPGLDGRGFHVQKAHGLVVALRVILHHLHGLQLLQAGFLGNLVLPFIGIVLQVSDVRDVADITHLVAQILQETEQHVIGDTRTGVAQMGVPIYGRAAYIHAHMSFMDGLEQFLVAGKGIGQIQRSHDNSHLNHAKIRNFFLNFADSESGLLFE